MKLSNGDLEKHKNQQEKEKHHIDTSVETTAYPDKKEIVVKSSDIRTLDDLIEYCKVDLRIWEVTKHIVNSWGSETYPCFQVKAWISKIKEDDSIDYTEQIEVYKDVIAEYVPRSLDLKKCRKYDSGNMLELSIPDLHLGRLAWEKETNDKNYDIKEARKVFIDAVEYSLNVTTSYKIERIMLLLGSDFFNVNNYANTTLKGTPQDEDSRPQKTYTYGWEMAVIAIDLCKQIAPVKVVIVPGNHDAERIMYLGTTLFAWYKDDDDVIIDYSPPTRKYEIWGDCLIGLTHGRDEKYSELPLTMALECPEFSSTKYREVHIAHLHHEKRIQFIPVHNLQSITVRWMPSLAPLSAWEFKKGYHQLHEAKGIVWNKVKGVIHEFNYHP